MFKVTSTLNCPYCVKAEEVLVLLNLPYKKTVLNTERKIAQFKAEGFATVPQIWHGSNHVGGYTELLTYIKEKVNGPPDT